jgi:hypothetical protein
MFSGSLLKFPHLSSCEQPFVVIVDGNNPSYVNQIGKAQLQFILDNKSHKTSKKAVYNRTPMQDFFPLLGMPSCPSLEPQFNGFDIVIIPRRSTPGLHDFKSSKDRHDMLPINFLLTPNETFGASGDDRATQHYRSFFPPLSASSTTSSSPEETAKRIVSSLKKDDVAKLAGCMIRSELTRQWINKHIKNTTTSTTSCDSAGADHVASGIMIPKTKQGCAKTSCPSVTTRRVSSSKRYFRRRRRSKQLAMRLLVGSITTTPAPAEETSKYLAQTTTSHTKTCKASGVLLQRPNPRIGMVSDYLRITQRA